MEENHLKNPKKKLQDSDDQHINWQNIKTFAQITHSSSWFSFCLVEKIMWWPVMQRVPLSGTLNGLYRVTLSTIGVWINSANSISMVKLFPVYYSYCSDFMVFTAKYSLNLKEWTLNLIIWKDHKFNHLERSQTQDQGWSKVMFSLKLFYV